MNSRPSHSTMSDPVKLTSCKPSQTSATLRKSRRVDAKIRKDKCTCALFGTCRLCDQF
jgi:hypothetical protein